MRKRIFDFVGASLLLLAAAPLMAVIAVWIKVTSPGPVIFRQVRIGLYGKPFTILKFRTMREGVYGPLDRVLPGDARVTAAGRFLRKFHIDELPQLVNVLRGEMSLVGPRPLPPEVLYKLVQDYRKYERRLEVLPGLTGLVQLRGRLWLARRGARGSLRLDTFYLKHSSLRFELYVLVKTVGVVVKGKGV